MKSTVPRRKTGSAVIKAFKTSQSDRYGACHVSQNAMLLMEGHAHLTNGLKSRERLLLLFTDSLIIAKTKSLYLKLKACVSLSDIWLASCIHIITDRKVTSKHSFVIGWPTTNYVATFSSSETKERWLQALQWHTCRARQRVLPNGILLYVLLLCNPDEDSPATIAVAVDLSTTAEHVVHYIKQQCKLLGEVSDYQLCVNYAKEEETYTLIGHELPFFILRHSLQSQQEPGEQETFNAAQQTEATIKTPHFTLKTRTYTPGVLLKHKRKRSLIDWALRRGQLNPSDEHVEEHNGPQKLFGQSLSSICPDGNLPKPIMDLLYLLFCEGPETCGIFRRSANAKNCRILKEKMNSGKSISLHEESVFVSASLITEFLRELPGGVLCCNLYEDWMEVLQIEDQKHRLYKVRSLLAQLSEENITLLCHLFGVLHRIHSHSHVNLMTATNLALCIAPNMLWRSARVSPEQEGKSALQVAQLIQYLIENTPAVFGEDLDSLFTRRIISGQETHESEDGPYLQHSSSEDTDQDFIASPPLSPEFHPLFLPLAALSLKEKRTSRPFYVDLPSSQGTYSCGTLDSISSRSGVSVSTLGVGKLSQSRDRCLSEPSMYFATPQTQIPTHTPIIRQSSYDAAVIDRRNEQSRSSVGLSPERQSHNSGMSTRRRRYTFWKSPQIPARFKHPAQKLASMSSLSSATTSSLSSLDSTLSLNSADPIPSPQDTQSHPFLFGAATKLRPLTPEMPRKRWTKTFTYEEEKKLGERDQKMENNEKERELEASHDSHGGEETAKSEEIVSSNVTEVENVQQQFLSNYESPAESVCRVGFLVNPLKSSNTYETEHDVDSQAISQKPCCIQIVPRAEQMGNKIQESQMKQILTKTTQRQIITKMENSQFFNARPKMQTSGGPKVSRMKITFFPSAGKVMLKYTKVRDQASKTVPMETEQGMGFTEQKKGNVGESGQMHVPQTLVLCSAPSQQMSVEEDDRCSSHGDTGVEDTPLDGETDVSVINSSLSNSVFDYPKENPGQNTNCVSHNKVNIMNAADDLNNPGSITENTNSTINISAACSSSPNISVFHANANQDTSSKHASKFAGTFRHTICIKLPVRNRGPAQNKPIQ